MNVLEGPKEKHFILLFEASQMGGDMIIEQPMGFGYIKCKLTKDKSKQIWRCYKDKWKCHKVCYARIYTIADYRNVGDKNCIVALKELEGHTCISNMNLLKEREIYRELKKEGKRPKMNLICNY